MKLLKTDTFLVLKNVKLNPKIGINENDNCDNHFNLTNVIHNSIEDNILKGSVINSVSDSKISSNTSLDCYPNPASDKIYITKKHV